MTNISAGVEFLRFIGQAFIILIGWYVVHRLSISRDRDKSRREMITKTADFLCDSVDAIFSIAREYHMTTRDTSKEFLIKNGLQDLSFRVVSLNKLIEEENYHASCVKNVISLRQAVTKSHFEDEHLNPLVGSEQQIELITESALNLKRALVELKHIQFPFQVAKSTYCAFR